MAKRGPLTPAYSTGDLSADASLRALVSACDAAFLDRVRNYLLSGSYARGDANSASDLDLGVVFRGSVSNDERQRLHMLTRDIEASGAIRLESSRSTRRSICMALPRARWRLSRSMATMCVAS